MHLHRTKTDRRPVSLRSDVRFAALLPLALGVSLFASSNAAAQPPAAQGEIAATIRACTGPAAAVARAHAQQGDAEVSAADVLPNPDVSIEHNRSLSGPLDHETVVGLAIPLGIGGARYKLQDAAEARRQALLLQATAERFEVAVQVRHAFAHASLEAARLEVLSEQQQAVEASIQRLSKLAEGGEASSYDVLRLQSQRAALGLQIKPRRARLEAERAWLEALVGAPVAIDAGAATRLQAAVRAARAPDAREHPAVASLRKQADADRLRAEAAERRWAPDVDVFVGYRMVGADPGQTGHGVSLGLSFPLTFFDYGQGEARQARADAVINDAHAELAKRQLEAGRKAAEARMHALRGGDEGEQALMLATRWVSDAGKLYTAGEGSLLDLLEALRARTDAKLAQLDLAEQQLESNVQWMRSTGQLLDPRLEASCARAEGGAR